MTIFRPSLQEIKERKKLKVWARGWADGYVTGNRDGVDHLSDLIIESLHQDAVLSMTADLDTLERVVEIIEAVREIGETPSRKTQD